MPDPTDIYATAFKNGSLSLLARIVDGSGNNVSPAAINAIKYSVYLLNDQDADERTAVEGHANAGLSIGSVLFASLQTGPLWTVDTIGYNFRHVLDVSTHQAFAIAGRRYLVEYQLTPATGQVILVRFRVNAI
ncbi:MAG: hypothetical protein LLG00_14360 [Planctomycetaceae bacterium]|nr:hypothetical protein [Planctomycetaceae bacterium]